MIHLIRFQHWALPLQRVKSWGRREAWAAEFPHTSLEKFRSSQSGGVIILIAVMFPVLMSILGITADMGRSYAAQSKLQNAADAALLGAVSTAATTTVATEARRIFDANYPNNYLGGSVQSFSVTQPSTGQYLLTVSVTLPTVIMQLFGQSGVNMTTTSRVNSGFQLAAPQSLELALVYDNSGNANVGAIRNATRTMTNIIFPNNNALSNVRIHLIPFDVAVNVGNTRATWAQAAFVASYNSFAGFAGGGRGFLSNRNLDAPPGTLEDVSDAAPTTDATRFRTPIGYGPTPPRNPTSSPDYVSTNRLGFMRFGSNSRSTINTALNGMLATTGNLRTNVGLMWGWFSLSPSWQGLLSTGLPGLPATNNPLVSKHMIFLVTRRNNVYTGQTNQSNDNTTTRRLCDTIKSRGIVMHVIGFGSANNLDGAMLQYCASGANYYYTATSQAQLTTVFRSIADQVRNDSLRLSQ